jgi:aspartyl-tRNA(Asn)/glutamyl-tRNA(Gln) amidotransferase subunit B
MEDYGLLEYEADILPVDRPISDYFETVLRAYGGNPKVVSNWIINEVLRMLNDLGVSADVLALTPAHLAGAIKLVDAGTVNVATGKALLVRVQESGEALAAVVEAELLWQVSDDAALAMVSTRRRP